MWKTKINVTQIGVTQWTIMIVYILQYVGEVSLFMGWWRQIAGGTTSFGRLSKGGAKILDFAPWEGGQNFFRFCHFLADRQRLLDTL